MATTEANEGLWALWRRLKSLFPTWSLLLSGLYTPGAWGYLGVDFISGFRRNPSTRQAFALLESVDEATFDGLSALASLNARRQDQMVRVVVLGYLTIPLSIAALVAEIAGDSLLEYFRENTIDVLVLAGTLALGPLAYLMSQWRSHQIVGVLDLIRIERGQTPFTALELRDD